MLKILNVTFTVLLLAGSWQLVNAQAPMSNYDYYNMRTIIVNGATANQAKGRTSELAVIEAVGARKIKAGKATMSFIPTPAGLERYTKNVQFDPSEPQILSEQVLYIKNYVKRFNEMLATAGGKVNNCADAYALSYSISYLAYYGKAPNTVDVKTLRQKYLEENMNSTYFQGLSDADKQWYYTGWALMSIQAFDEREKANQASSPRERKEAENKAKNFGKYGLGIN